MMMQTTRRAFLGTVGAVTAAAAARSEPTVTAAAGDEGKFYIAACTPCDKSLKFDDGALKDMFAWFRDQGADGVVVLGTTGEFPSFSVAERKRIAETALKHRNGLLVVIGSGSSNVPETIELSQHAAANEADGLLLIPPYYFKDPPLAGLTKYYSMIFEQVKIPISLYHIPRTSGVAITSELLHSLEHYPHLTGIKDSNGDVKEYDAYLKEFPKLSITTGTARLLEQALDHGMGAILAEGNLLTKQIAAVFAAKRAGVNYKEPLAKLRAAEQVLQPLGVNRYGPMKYALSLMMGQRQTYQRPPHLDVTDEQKVKIKQALDQLKTMA
jgi:4-hydroxy-tetrahydrodipicolinate synthase